MKRLGMFGLVIGWMCMSGCGTYIPWSLGVKDDVVAGGDVTARDDLNVGGTINAPDGGNIGGVVFDGDGNVTVPGTVTIGEEDDVVVIPPLPPPVAPPPPPPDDEDEPMPLFVDWLEPVNGSTLEKGKKFDVVLDVSGGIPPYTVTCLIPGGTFLKEEFGLVDLEQGLVRLTTSINSPTNESIFCSVKDNAGNSFPSSGTLSSWIVIK